MLENVIRSGVAFSHDPNTCSPYRVINWNEVAIPIQQHLFGRSNMATSGEKRN